jgi:poly(3-hydroxybutyrate) depolymerase
MIYRAYQTQSDVAGPLRAMAQAAAIALHMPLLRMAGQLPLSHLAATYELWARAGLSHQRPAFGIASIRSGAHEVAVSEEAVHVTPFSTLLRFKKESAVSQPRVLLIAPMSGHFATLLRGTVRTLLPEHDVYITDWSNARDVGLRHGRFGFDDFIAHIIEFLKVLGPGAHVVAICQPAVAALAAVALMAEEDHPAVPRSMTLMAGPVDARVSPTKVNALATSHSIAWFERNLIARVPWRYAGALRRVYPGFMQLAGFMSMNLERHMRAQFDLFDHLVRRERQKAASIRTFYDEYFAVMDLPAEFYLETIRFVFQEYLLACGRLAWRGRPVDPKAIRRTALLTIEGEKDDICAVGQTLAAQELCSSLRPYLKRHYVQAGVGHYGVFNGRRWNNEIYPVLRNVILSRD